MLDANHLKTLIRAALPDAEVELVDTRGTGDHFQARVVCPSFEGRSMVEQHRMVYAPLQDELGSGALHALALSTYTPAEWAKRKP
jgi:acid stress-induced BolA-like protein IbaG/YrbA